jgi:hypothetical protein
MLHCLVRATAVQVDLNTNRFDNNLSRREIIPVCISVLRLSEAVKETGGENLLALSTGCATNLKTYILACDGYGLRCDELISW